MENHPASTRPTPELSLAVWYLLYDEKHIWNLALCIPLAVCVALALRSGKQSDPDAEGQIARKQFIAFAPPPVVDSENAALDYDAAFYLRVGWNGKQSSDPNYYYSSLRDRYALPWNDPNIEAYLNANVACLSRVFRGATRKSCNFKLDYTQVYRCMLPHLKNMHTLELLLGVRARFEARQGLHELAAEDLCAWARMARDVRTDPTWVTQNHADEMTNTLLSAMGEILRETAPQNPAHLDAYARVLREIPDDTELQNSSVKSLECQKQLMINLISDVAVHPGTLKALGEKVDLIEESQSYAMNVWYPSEREFIQEVFDSSVRSIKVRRLLRDEDLSRIRRNHEGPVLLYNHIPGRIADKVSKKNQITDRVCLLNTALAILRYRQKYHDDPEYFTKLAPEFLPCLPLDRRERPILKCIRLATKYWPSALILYSLGDGEIDYVKKHESASEPNIAIELPLPEDMPGGSP